MAKLNVFILIIMFIFHNNLSYTQDTIVAWTFPTGSADSLVDISIPLNSARYLSCQYGTFGSPSYYNININYSVAGTGLNNDYCAMASGLANGADSIYWMIKFKTTGYGNLTLYSKQRASLNNFKAGPAYFRLQYKLSGSSTWITLIDSIKCDGDWATGSINGFSLPAVLNNQSGHISIRWLQITNYDIIGNPVLNNDSTMIDDIVITGAPISGIETYQSVTSLNVYPNPANSNFTIEVSGKLNSLKILDLTGKCLFQTEKLQNENLKFEGYKPGIYFVHGYYNNNIFTRKIVRI
ncbi:MAG TPA: T9SS type A sorting domain-containing protein [Bacteroidales bacterium]|nr:T9SS type A sorting domain-containing protein [Bacteroidales bacterium]